MRDLLSDTKFTVAAVHFAKCCAASRMHQDLAIESVKRYGDHGPNISGIVRDHFPDDVKNTLRMLARRICEESDAAWLARPAYARNVTMRKLGSLIAKRDGSGFYGPQA